MEELRIIFEILGPVAGLVAVAYSLLFAAIFYTAKRSPKIEGDGLRKD